MRRWKLASAAASTEVVSPCASTAAGFVAHQGIVQAFQQAAEQRVERLVRPHHVEVDVGLDAEQAQRGVEQVAMLRGDEHAALERGVTPSGAR